MKFSTSALKTASLIAAISPFSGAESIRGMRGGNLADVVVDPAVQPAATDHQHHSHRNLAKPNTDNCTVAVAALLEINPGSGELADDIDIACVMDPSDADGKSNQGRKINGSADTMRELKNMVKRGDIIPGETTLQLESDVGVGRSSLVLPDKFDIKNRLVKNGRGKGLKNGRGKGQGGPGQGQGGGQGGGSNKGGRNGGSNRRLNVMGEKPILVVKVTDGSGKARSESVDQISDDIFGTYGDPVNLKSQLEACSMGSMTVVPGDNDSGQVNETLYVAPGVMEVTVGLNLTNTDRYDFHNEVTAQVQNMLGFPLPGPYEQVMYVVEGCYVGCGYAAYAYINSWMSVFQSVYYKHVGVLVHELGHNFGLAHSGKVGGGSYTDHTGMMGNPLYSDDVGKMCYNGAKNWQIGWYDNHKLELFPLDQANDWSVAHTLVGIADYENNDWNHNVVIKLETGTGADFFVAFNRATGVNSQNDEGDDLVTITAVESRNGEAYSQSWQHAALAQGGQFTIESFGGGSRGLIVSVPIIDLTTDPGTATVRFEWEPQVPTSSPTPCPGSPLTVNVVTDNYPAETTWTLFNNCNGASVGSGGPYVGQGTSWDQTWCVEADQQFKFTISDTFGDGICCSWGTGGYTVTYGATQVTGGDFGSSEEKFIGSCAPTPTPPPTPATPTTPLPTTTPPTPESPSPTTPSPTPSPTTPPPTKSPTPNPTNPPSPSPTTKPTDSPTLSPTNLPSTSSVPTPFTPEIVELSTPSTSPAHVIRAAYFEVVGGDVWSTITNLKIWTYGTTSIELYFKYGSAEGYEATPCAWKKVAETSSSWYGGYWGRNVSPPWINGFEPVVLPPNEKVSFYIVNVGSSYGILGKSHSYSNRYESPYESLDATSAAGAVVMSHGKSGYADMRFKPQDYGRNIYGTIVLETMRPGSTESPTASPTAPWTPGTLESSFIGATSAEFNGLQFDVENYGSEDVIVTKFSVLFADTGTKNIEIWTRSGSHALSEAGCNNWNNWCNQWTKLASNNVYSSASTSFTDTPQFAAVAKAGATTSFAIITGDSRLLVSESANIVSNELLRVKPASPISDHYGSSVQTSHTLSLTKYSFQGMIYYDIAHGECAIHSKADWVVLDPTVATAPMSDNIGGDGDYEVEEIVRYDPKLSQGGSKGPAEELLE